MAACTYVRHVSQTSNKTAVLSAILQRLSTDINDRNPVFPYGARMYGWRALVLPLIMGAHEEPEMQSQLGPVWQQAMLELLIRHVRAPGAQQVILHNRRREQAASWRGCAAHTCCAGVFPCSRLGLAPRWAREGGVEMLVRRHWRAESASNCCGRNCQVARHCIARHCTVMRVQADGRTGGRQPGSHHLACGLKAKGERG